MIIAAQIFILICTCIMAGCSIATWAVLTTKEKRARKELELRQKEDTFIKFKTRLHTQLCFRRSYFDRLVEEKPDGGVVWFTDGRTALVTTEELQRLADILAER